METIKSVWNTVQPYIDNPVIHILLIVTFLFIAQKIIRQFIHKIVRSIVKSHRYQTVQAERQREQTLEGVFRAASAVLLWIVGILLVLTSLNVNVPALLTGAGVVGIIVGFGAQNSIKDFLAGIYIILENQYRVGDIVTLAGVSGQVESISIRITRLRDLDGYMHIIPNGEAKVVTNMSFVFSNVNLNIGVSYDADIDKVIKVINAVGKDIAQDATWHEFISEPIAFLRVDSFDDSAVKVKCIGKVAPGKQWDVAGEFRHRIKDAFDKNGIEIPYPQRVVHSAKK